MAREQAPQKLGFACGAERRSTIGGLAASDLTNNLGTTHQQVVQTLVDGIYLLTQRRQAVRRVAHRLAHPGKRRPRLYP